MENIQNYKDALASVSKKEMEQRKTIKRLLQEKEELKKQLALHDVSNFVKQELERRVDLILSEPDGIVRETMINNLLIDINCG